MVQLNTLNANYNQFGFELTTSSGDKIALSMYDNQTIETELQSGKGGKKIAMSLRHEYGYSFRYEGNGIDAKDQKEIEEAMKLIRPMFQKYLESVQKSDEMPGLDEVTNITQLLKGELPQPKDENTQNYLKDRTVSEMDDILSLFEESQKILDSAKAFFDKLFDASKMFEMYA
jgi:hypothetical protein